MEPFNVGMSRRTLLRGFGGLAGLGALTACGGGTSSGGASGSGDSGHLRVSVWGGEGEEEAYGARLGVVTEQYSDITTKLEVYPNDAYAQKVQTIISGGSGLDLMQVAEEVHVYSSKNQLLPLDELLDEAGIDLDALVGRTRADIYRYEGQTYAIPDRSGSIILFYNRAHFDAAGVDHPTADWTWDDLVAAATELTDPGAGRWGFGGVTSYHQWWSFVYQNGGRILDEEGRPTVNSDAAVEALQFCGDLALRLGIAPTAEQLANFAGGEASGTTLFAAGNASMNLSGFWNVPGLLEGGEIDFDVAPIWRGPTGIQAVAPYGSAFAIPRNSKNQRAAFSALQVLSSPAGQEYYAVTGGDVPANLEVQNGETFLQPAWADRPVNIGAFAESSEFIIDMPYIPEWNQMQDAMTNGLADFWLGRIDAREALDNIQGQLESIITPANG
ncbi:sugar ABC transporter substrate-binding protein [Streptomyces sp. NBRC 109706]|uniref:ABC transporter substrate-binding protein n=1 Tax=Streptomyces sp. NBRC 109706 TaxID=1550035 RepID=UPI000781E948|nr:sugar ABC transporter substrate-binding protein [Streptomyces sp. NBRC 109706]